MTKYFIIGLNKTGTTSIRSALGASLQVTSILKIVPKKNICKLKMWIIFLLIHMLISDV